MMKTTACSLLLILILQSCGRTSQEEVVVSEKTGVTQLPQLLQQQQLQGVNLPNGLCPGGKEFENVKANIWNSKIRGGSRGGRSRPGGGWSRPGGRSRPGGDTSSGPGVGRGAAGRAIRGRTKGGGNTALRQKEKKSNGTSAAVPLSYLLHCIVALFLASILCTKV